MRFGRVHPHNREYVHASAMEEGGCVNLIAKPLQESCQKRFRRKLLLQRTATI